MSTTTITPDQTMGEIIEAIPAARRALFQRYHIGGCSSCAYELTDTLAAVCKNKNILDVNEVVEHLYRAQELDENMQVDPSEVRAWLEEGRDFTFMDVRTETERVSPMIPEAEVLEFARSSEYLAMDKTRMWVFACEDGGKSIDVAAYFAGHGFEQVRVLRGGFPAWNA
ncbi:MAG: rhodanese-like domain-containing protein [Planctomycetota bacterium]|nr:rhodanese-like domain-containing protein [Planctomycetota bacterium]